MKVKCGAIVTGISGKLGSQVFQGSKHGLLLRSGAKSTFPPTSAQINRQLFYSQICQAWKMLSSNNRASWFFPSDGDKSGFQLFLSINLTRLASGYFIALSFADAYNPILPTDITQGNWSQSLGSIYGFVQADNGNIVACGGSGALSQYAPDGTDNWIVTTSGYTSLSCFAIIKLASGTILMAGSVAGKVFRSTNHGVSFSEVNTGFSIGIAQSIIVSHTGSALLVGRSSPNIYESTDDGITWHLWKSLGSYVGGFHLRTTPDGGYLCSTVTPFSLVRLDNGASSFRLLFNAPSSAPFANVTSVYNNCVIVVHSTQAMPYFSGDYGKSFIQQPIGLASGYIGLPNALARNILLCRRSSDNFILYSYNLGKSWFQWLKPTYQQYMLCYMLSSSNYLYIGGYTSGKPIRALMPTS